MKNLILSLTFLFIFLSPLTAEENSPELEKIDKLVSFTESDFQAVYTITQIKPGQGKTVTVSDVYRRDKDEKYSIIIKSPSYNKGQGYLKIKDTLWFYDPESRQYTSTSSKEKFQNSNARNSDFTKSTLAIDYNIVSQSQGKLGKHDCTIYELEGKTNELNFPYMKIWVNKDNLILKSEDYSLSHQLLRITAIPSYQKKDNKFVPSEIHIIDALLGARVNGKFVNERTIIKISEISFAKLSNSTFSKSFLERKSQ